MSISCVVQGVGSAPLPGVARPAAPSFCDGRRNSLMTGRRGRTRRCRSAFRRTVRQAAGRITRKPAALPRPAVDLQRSAMAADDVLDDRQAQPGAARGAAAMGVDAVESLGQARDVAADRFPRPRRSPRAAPHRPAPAAPSRTVTRPRGRPYFTAFSIRLASTCCNWSASPAHQRRPGAGVDDQLGALGFQHRLQRRRGAPHDRRQIDRLARADPLLGLDPAQRQQVRDQPVHPLRLALHDPEEPLARRRIVAGGGPAGSR